MTLAAQPSAIQRALLRRILTNIRHSDFAAAQRVTSYIANSAAVQARIANYYQRTSEVVYPFVDAG